MADYHHAGSGHKHGSSLSDPVEEHAKQRGKYHGEHREEAEQMGSLVVRYAQGFLDEVGGIPLEREDGAVVEHAEQGYNPEHLALENSA